MLHSYELLARYVMPQFQGSVASTAASNRWTAERRETLVAGRTRAIEQAREDYTARVR
jgi:limonene 1,2-monooxygenase